MHRNSIVFLVLSLLAISAVIAQVRDLHTASEPGFTRRLVIDQPTVQVVRSTYAPGASEPPGPHSFDVVLVPVNQAKMDLKIEGKAVEWKFAEPIFIGRGVQHNLANKGKEPAEAVSIRMP